MLNILFTVNSKITVYYIYEQLYTYVTIKENDYK